MITAGNAVRIQSEADIPDFLRETISIEGGEMVMYNAESEDQRASFGTVCVFEISQKTAFGYRM
jgi:hypothetical protein